MSDAGTSSGTAALQTMLERFDPGAFDVPPGRPRVRLLVQDTGEEWDAVLHRDRAELCASIPNRRPDALIAADAHTWHQLATDIRGGLGAHAERRLHIRHNLHLAVGLLAATAGWRAPGRLRCRRIDAPKGPLSIYDAGTGEAVVLIHGLGANKASFLPTIAALAPRFRTIAVDLPGFGESRKPVGAAYDPPFFANAMLELLDTLELKRAHVVGHSLGGRTAVELGLCHPERLISLTLMMPGMAWRRTRRLAPLVRLLRPELGLLQPAPRLIVQAVVGRLFPGTQDGVGVIAMDEFLRSYCDPRGRAALYASARSLYLDEPLGSAGLWTRLPQLGTRSLVIWGEPDPLVPVAFARHVRTALPDAEQVVLDCGHVPQLECPDDLHAAIRGFLERHSSPE